MSHRKARRVTQADFRAAGRAFVVDCDRDMRALYAWRFDNPEGEPPFWSRRCAPNEFDGLDPLTGRIIAHTVEERERLTWTGRSTLTKES